MWLWGFTSIPQRVCLTYPDLYLQLLSPETRLPCPHIVQQLGLCQSILPIWTLGTLFYWFYPLSSLLHLSSHGHGEVPVHSELSQMSLPLDSPCFVYFDTCRIIKCYVSTGIMFSRKLFCLNSSCGHCTLVAISTQHSPLSMEMRPETPLVISRLSIYRWYQPSGKRHTLGADESWFWSWFYDLMI